MHGSAARGQRGGWSLPARPPEQWVSPTASLALNLALGLSVVVPLAALLRTGSRTATTASGALLAVAVACSCAVAAYALHVQAAVHDDRRLTWLAAGPLLLLPAVLHLALDGVTGHRPVPSEALLVHAALPVLALTSPLAGRSLVLLALPGALLLGAGALALSTDDPAALLPAALALSVVGLLVWCATAPRGSPWGWVTLSLALGSAALAAAVAAPRDDVTAPGAAAAALPLLVLALALGLRTTRGYGRQVRRWRELEQQVRDARLPTALLPGRSVVPEDDEGLPDPDDVQRVLDEGAVAVALQPVLRLSDRTVVGQEALARFEGRIPTERWFRGASRYGLGLPLELLCLERALALLPTLPPEQFLAVNVSPAALAHAPALELFASAPLDRVVVEVTEHEAVADYPGVRATLDRLRRAGARVAVDDTGAGFASLRHVLLLQPEVVKLDTVLVRDLAPDSRGRRLVVSLAAFVREVGSTVLAEGVETAEQVHALREIGVDLGQGWHLGVPVLPEEPPARTPG